METLDRISARFGKGTLSFASSGFERPWWMRQARKSKLFTTSWADLPLVR
ncbi:MAG TPA: DUF4113 domain-containing protein [Deltaproteobacteria bacterium]|jgi:DNA polymerase V|nr:DUF4113 domain-containing protein [Deltaproteobacteria bacterium]HOI06545.1 DUF4113 domain-containing protein [Deltaproteobacteria bacterium]